MAKATVEEFEPKAKDEERGGRASPFWRQSFAAGGSLLATLSAGMTSGYSATLLPQLRAPDSPIPVTPEVESWIAAVAALPMFAGCLLSGVAMERYGRRAAHLMLAVPFVIGWLLAGTAQGLEQLLAGRFLTGLCVGLLGPAGSVYIGEISDPHVRGFLLSGISLGISAGVLLVHALDAALDWRTTALLSAIVPAASFVALLFAPESPSWLAAEGRLEEAAAAFEWLRGRDPASLAELETMLSKAPIAREPASSVAESLRRFGRALAKPEFLRPLLIMTGFFLALQLTGVNALAFYTVSIMASTLGDGFDEYAATLTLDGVRLAASVAAGVLLRTSGRRPLALWSCLATAASLFGLTAVRSLDVGGAWAPLALFVGYVVATTAGLAPLPWVMTGEVFPADLRGVGSGACTCVNFIAFFVVVKTAPAAFALMGVEGAYALCGCVALLAAAGLYAFLPETRGRTLQSVEEGFGRDRSAGRRMSIDN